MNHADIARVCHEVNRAYCAGLGDYSQTSWEEAPEWQRASAGSGVAFHLATPDATPSASHEKWMADKAQDGWTWGPVKNPALKQHPCMVAFVDLPLEQQMKDRLFKAVVDALRGNLV